MSSTDEIGKFLTSLRQKVLILARICPICGSEMSFAVVYSEVSVDKETSKIKTRREFAYYCSCGFRI